MELVVLILSIGLVLLWVRTSGLNARHRILDEQMRRLQASLADLQDEMDGLPETPANVSAATREASPPGIGRPAIVPAASPAIAATSLAATAPGPIVAPPTRVPGPPVRQLWVRPAEPSRRTTPVGPTAGWPAQAPRVRVEPPPAFEAVPTPPSGPGILDRLLLQLGLTGSTPGEKMSRSALEAWLEGRMLAIVGGIALLLGAVFFLSLAFARGWITEPLRVLIGLVVGAGLMVLGELSFTRLRGILGHVLVAVGLATVSLALLAATRQYHLAPVELCLLGAFIAAIAAAVIAVRHDSQLVAAYGLVAVLAAPPLLGASPTVVTLLFVAATLVGTTGVALFRTWIWLPPIAFALSAPQLVSYVTGGPPAVEGLVVIAGFWLVNLVAAGGEEIRHATDRLRPSTVTLLLADVAFTMWAGFTVLSGPQEAWRGSFLAVLAVAHLALGLLYFVRNGDRHPFGLVVAATGVAALTMAVPVQFGGPVVPIAWAAEGVALAWAAVARRHPYSATVAGVLGALALGHLVTIEYTPAALVAGFAHPVPFVGAEGMTFAFMIAALAVAGLVVPIAWVRAGLAAIGGLVALYVFPFELSGPALVAGWAALATVGCVAYARAVTSRIPPGFREDRVPVLGLPALFAGPVSDVVSATSILVRPIFIGTALFAGIGALVHLAGIEYAPGDILRGTPHDIPFVGLPGLAFAIVLAAMVGIGLLIPRAWVRVALAALGGLVALYVLPFELSGPALVAAWAALATAGFAVEVYVIEPRVGPTLRGPGFIPYVRPAVRSVGALVGVALLAHLVSVDFPLVDTGARILSPVPYAGPEGLSLAAGLAALAAIGWLMGARWIRLAMAGIGAMLLVFTVTFEVGLPFVTVAWGVLAVASLAVVRRISLVGLLPEPGRPILEWVAERLPYAGTVLALGFLVVQSLLNADLESFGRHVMGDVRLAGTPFLDERTFVLLVLAATLVVGGWIWRGITPRVWGGVAAGLVIAWLLPFEVRPGYAVAGWAGLALAGLWTLRFVPVARLVLGSVSVALAAFGSLVAVAIVAPPDRLVVDLTTTVPGWSILSDATVALGALAIAFGAGALLHRGDPLSLAGRIAAAVAVVYLLSVGVADQFQLQVGIRPLEELQKEAQVGLSVLWSVLGAGGFAAGLAVHRTRVRLFGLGLLGLATLKVFFVDLAALDVAYRVLSLVALGVLLLVSAAVYGRMQHPHGPVAMGHP